ncbi:MAG: COMM domain-containing protein [Pseudomonadota bacterium]
MKEEHAADGQLPALRALGGARVSTDVATGWHAFIALPQPAKDDIWNVLAPLLRNPADPQNPERFQQFCKLHGIEAAATAPALEALNRLLSYASAVDLPEEDFAADLETLSGGTHDPAIASVLAEYAGAKAALRTAALRASIADHGKLLTRIDWRVDDVSSSNHGLEFKAPVMLLTFHFREGQREERITLQLLPDTMRELQDVCSRFVV